MKETIDLLGKIIANILTALYEPFGFSLLLSYAKVEGVVNPDTESYYHYFLSGEIYRDCCYQCPYAQRQHVGDITVGDYWGVQKYDPQLLVEQGGTINSKEGVSCLLINTECGQHLVEKYGA